MYGSTSVMSGPMRLIMSRPGIPWFWEGVLPPDLARVVTALAYLHHAEDGTEVLLVLGVWRWHLPLLYQRLTLGGAPGSWSVTRERPDLEARHPEMLRCHALHT